MYSVLYVLKQLHCLESNGGGDGGVNRQIAIPLTKKQQEKRKQ